jgi:hypothetical protein
VFSTGNAVLISVDLAIHLKLFMEAETEVGTMVEESKTVVSPAQGTDCSAISLNTQTGDEEE